MSQPVKIPVDPREMAMVVEMADQFSVSTSDLIRQALAAYAENAEQLLFDGSAPSLDVRIIDPQRCESLAVRLENEEYFRDLAHRLHLNLSQLIRRSLRIFCYANEQKMGKKNSVLNLAAQDTEEC